MDIVTKIGDRFYGFNDPTAATHAGSLFAHCTGSQNEFEEQMVNDDIEFTLEPPSCESVMTTPL